MGIPPAPRGVPQIEVVFDVDVDGILDVSARDLGTGHEQQIRVTATGGLSPGQVDELLADAVTHADEDAVRRQEVQLVNTAEGLLYSVEQTLEEYGQHLTDEERQEVEESMANSRKAMEGDDVEALRLAVEDLQQLAYRMTEVMYERLGSGDAGPPSDKALQEEAAPDPPVADSDPEAVVKLHIDPVVGLTDWQARELVYRGKLEPTAARAATAALKKLYEAFVSLDCDLVEVNPLILTGSGEIVALDSKVTLDSNAFFRHPDFGEFEAAFHRDPIEAKAKERDLNFIKLEGSVGIIGNGAGLVMSTLDIVDLVGGSASNFLDVGGGAGADTILNALEVLTHDETVKSVLINIFGGITRCDLVAQGIIEALDRLELPWPIVVRLDGTNADAGRALLAESRHEKLIPASTMREAAERAVQLAGTG